MKDDAIGEALRALPREMAEPGFTDAVLARLDAEPGVGRPTVERRRLRLAWAGAALAAAALAAAVGLAFRSGAPPAAPERAAAISPAPAKASGPEPLEERAPTPSRALLAGVEPGTGPSAPSLSGAPAISPAVLPQAPSGRSPAADAPEPLADLARARAELAELRRRHHRFAFELRTLSDLAGDRPPVLFLGGDEGLEVVLDLGRQDVGTLPAAGGRRRPGAVGASQRAPLDPRYH